MKFINSHELIRAPFYPHPGQEIIRQLKAALETIENPSELGLDQKEVAELIGIPRSTLHEWLHSDQVTPIKRFLSGLERLPEEKRISFFRSFCRHCPRLGDSKIPHDKEANASIESTLRSPGITLVTGSSDSARTYLLTAIGNSFAARRAITGFDVHPPMHLVPVPGVCYPRTNLPADALPSLFANIWPNLTRSEDSMIILNGIWNRIPSHHRAILKLATKNNIFIGDDLQPQTFVRGSRQKNVIRVESIGGKNGVLRIDVEVG